ncbi:sulfite exporter TauE/SafE family protein [Lacisediminimonas profundi]|uniref:sulfite exporter TauE/SafE family protein n=1 Tax=Lacisediminimonas profundi TaxID=2603856 RepID=UPI00124BA314|nr:sulfite exporter TauE/SafE family protein [Lacisediminimonas profundi]
MDYPVSTLAFIAVIFILAGTVKGFIGLGLPTVAIGLLTFRIGTPEAVTMLIMPTVITNLWQLVSGPRFVHLIRRFLSLLACLFIGAFIGVRLLIDGEFATVMLGLVLTGYGVLGLTNVQFTVAPRWEARLSPLTGVVTGVLYGSTGLGVTAVPYVGALGLSKDETIQAMGLIFSVMSLATALALAWAGKYHPTVAGTSAMALLPAMVGMMIGQRLRDRVSAVVFRRCFFIAIVALGIYTVLHGIR